MATVTVVPASRVVALTSVPTIRRRPWLAFAIFPLCDGLAVAAAGIIVLFFQHVQTGLALNRYLTLWPPTGAVLLAFACARLYPGVVHNAVDELRRITIALTLTFSAIAVLLLAGPGRAYRPVTLLLWWAVSMVVVPGLRATVRDAFCRSPWWGQPVAVFHTGEASLEIIGELEAHPEVGLRPVVVMASPLSAHPRTKLPVLDLGMAGAVRACGVECALIMLSDTGASTLFSELEAFESVFPRLILMHHAATLYNLTVDARQVSGRLALEVRRNLLLPLPRFAKRALDLLVVLAALPVVAFIIVLLGLLVRLESPGPAFYAHPRIGRHRSVFRTWKIRTMLLNGDEVLRQALAQDEAMQLEWSRDRKLRQDPRVTRVGKFLRKTSLDELPQLWNVLRGEMSLVGPRPIIEQEVAAYGQSFSLYCRVTPGLTGLWQVSGRSDVSCSDRVRLDSYYVRNWSPWLDLHILARTARVVVTGQGAY